MLKTLDRYVIREILPPLLLSLLIFTFILEIPPVMEQLESLVSKGVSWTRRGTDADHPDPAGARTDDPDGPPGRAADRARPAVWRPRGGRAPGLRRQPVSAASARHGPDGGRRGRQPLCDDPGIPDANQAFRRDHL